MLLSFKDRNIINSIYKLPVLCVCCYLLKIAIILLAFSYKQVFVCCYLLKIATLSIYELLVISACCYLLMKAILAFSSKQVLACCYLLKIAMLSMSSSLCTLLSSEDSNWHLPPSKFLFGAIY